MLALKDRQSQIPNGLTFYEASTKWQPPKFASFETIVQSLIAQRKANPYNTAKNKLATDYQAVCREVDTFNARLCTANGWTKFVLDQGAAPPPPKSLSPQHQSNVAAAAGTARRIWAGVRTLNDWIDSGEPAVEQGEADPRAAICVVCPLNGQGGLEKWFSIPASEAIKRQFQKLESRKLATPHDAKLGICMACTCPMKSESLDADEVHQGAPFSRRDGGASQREELLDCRGAMNPSIVTWDQWSKASARSAREQAA